MTKEEIDKILKWYCLDCDCNDRCIGSCFFKSTFKEYLEGNENMVPPKFDWTTMSNFYRFHHLLERNMAHNLKENNKRSEEWKKGYSDCLEFMRSEIKRLIDIDI